MTKGPRKVKLVIVVNNKKDPPTFKTLTPTSRTQLKQQLMREHAQEQLRRESLQAATGGGQKDEDKKKSNPTDVPRAVPHVELPPQVLQVRTVLENPTRYHVIQKQKSQVRQFLSESLQPHGQGRGAPTLSAPELGAKPPLSPDRASSSSVLSPGLGSVATSNSEADDLFEDILSLDGGNGLSSSGPPSGASSVAGDCALLTESDMHALAKDRQKKDNHNMTKDRQRKENHNIIERRRRFNINDRIKELGTLLPKTNDPFYDVIRDVRPNKGTILKSSVDYIKCLRDEVNRLKQSEQRRKQIELHNRKLTLRIQELERLAKLHGVPMPSGQSEEVIPEASEPEPVVASPARAPSVPNVEIIVPKSEPTSSNLMELGEQPPDLLRDMPSLSSDPLTQADADDALEGLKLNPCSPLSRDEGLSLGCLDPDLCLDPEPDHYLHHKHIKMRLSPSHALLSSESGGAALNLAQIEDLMDDDVNNPHTAGDPMLCSSPTSHLCLSEMVAEAADDAFAASLHDDLLNSHRNSVPSSLMDTPSMGLSHGIPGLGDGSCLPSLLLGGPHHHPHSPHSHPRQHCFDMDLGA